MHDSLRRRWSAPAPVLALVVFGFLLSGCQITPHASDDGSSDLAALSNEIAELQRRITAREDVDAIVQLMNMYGYYMDHALYDEVLALLSDDVASCEIGGYGVFHGKEGCRRLWKDLIGKYYGGDRNRMVFGYLVKHYITKPVVTLGSDGTTAKGRFDYLGAGGRLATPGREGFQLGVYNIDFVKEDGIWKIGKFWLTFNTSGFLAADWPDHSGFRCPSPDVRPDAPTTWYHPFPETGIPPFHFAHPVTGQLVEPYVHPQRYWIGNWPGEFGGPCGKRETHE